MVVRYGGETIGSKLRCGGTLSRQQYHLQQRTKLQMTNYNGFIVFRISTKVCGQNTKMKEHSTNMHKSNYNLYVKFNSQIDNNYHIKYFVLQRCCIGFDKIFETLVLP